MVPAKWIAVFALSIVWQYSTETVGQRDNLLVVMLKLTAQFVGRPLKPTLGLSAQLKIPKLFNNEDETKRKRKRKRYHHRKNSFLDWIEGHKYGAWLL